MSSFFHRYRIGSLAAAGVLIALAVGTSACADPAADKPKATVGAPSNAAPTSPAPTSSGGRVIALTHLNTSVEFTGSKVTGSHEGYFKKLSGSVQLDPASVEKSSVNVEIDTTSVTTDADGLTEHLSLIHI